MSLGIHENVLDHELLSTSNTKTVIFVDTSQYMEEPDRPLLEITLPGYNTYFLTNYTSKQVNVFNSGTIGLNKALTIGELIDLPDGIWMIKQKICPYNYVYKIKKWIRVEQLNCKISNIYEKIDLKECQTSKDKEIENDLIKIHSLIEGAKAIVNKNSKEAYLNYQLANKMVDNILNKLCKNCK